MPKTPKKEAQEPKEFAFHRALKQYDSGFKANNAASTAEAEETLKQAAEFCEKEILPAIVGHIQKVLFPQHFKEILSKHEFPSTEFWMHLGELTAKGLKADQLGIDRVEDLLAGIIQDNLGFLVEHEMAKYKKQA